MQDSRVVAGERFAAVTTTTMKGRLEAWAEGAKEFNFTRSWSTRTAGNMQVRR